MKKSRRGRAPLGWNGGGRKIERDETPASRRKGEREEIQRATEITILKVRSGNRRGGMGIDKDKQRSEGVRWSRSRRRWRTTGNGYECLLSNSLCTLYLYIRTRL